jgi:hypothetical protein
MSELAVEDRKAARGDRRILPDFPKLIGSLADKHFSKGATDNDQRMQTADDANRRSKHLAGLVAAGAASRLRKRKG